MFHVSFGRMVRLLCATKVAVWAKYSDSGASVGPVVISRFRLKISKAVVADIAQTKD